MKLGLYAILLLMGLSVSAQAETLRCGTKIVEEGMYTDQVRERCGEPDQITTGRQPVWIRGRGGHSYSVSEIEVTYWIYNRGSTQMKARLTFQGDTLQSITFYP